MANNINIGDSKVLESRETPDGGRRYKFDIRAEVSSEVLSERRPWVERLPTLSIDRRAENSSTDRRRRAAIAH